MLRSLLQAWQRTGECIVSCRALCYHNGQAGCLHIYLHACAHSVVLILTCWHQVCKTLLLHRCLCSLARVECASLALLEDHSILSIMHRMKQVDAGYMLCVA